MSKAFLIVLVIVQMVIIGQGRAESQPKGEIRGCIKIQGANDIVPTFRILFGGKEIKSNSEGFYTIVLDEKKREKYSFIVCKTILQNLDQTNTLKNFSVIPEKQHRYFVCQQGPYEGNSKHQEKSLNKKNFIIPDNSIVVLIDPKYIDRIEPWNLSLADNIFKLPTIVLKNSVSHNKLQRASAKSLIYSFDHTIFHEPVREITQDCLKNKSVSISQVQ